VHSLLAFSRKAEKKTRLVVLERKNLAGAAATGAASQKDKFFR
jgi:hypothetical protein